MMGIPVLIIGRSGSGKSCSMRNFEPSEVGIFNVASKPLPFRSKLKKADKAGYSLIFKGLSKPKLKAYVIDDSQYLMAFTMFEKVNEKGYGKFTEIAVNFYNLVQYVINNTPDDVIVYFLHHSEETDHGIKAKTVGKMLDDQLTLEGLFSIVIMAVCDKGEYKFITKNDGTTTVKTPMDMFSEPFMDNDLKVVDTTIREYLGGPENEKTE